MNDALFPLPDSPSPKLQWIRKHGLVTEYYPETVGLDEDEFGNDVFPWVCRVIKTDSIYSPREIGGGQTEEEAIIDFCTNSGTPHYSLAP